MKNTLLEFFRSVNPTVTPQMFAKIAHLFRYQHIKGQTKIQSPESRSKMVFILEGVLAYYIIDIAGEQKVCCFSTDSDNQFAGFYLSQSSYREQIGHERLEVVSGSARILTFDLVELEEAIWRLDLKSLYDVYREVIRECLARFVKSYSRRLETGQTARDEYLYLKAHKAYLFESGIQQKHIASYLGISPQYLSKLVSELEREEFAIV